MHICVSLPDPSLAQALAAKEWCHKGSFVNEASRLMVEGPGTAFLFRRVRPQNCMKTSCFWKDVCILLLQVRFLAESLSLKPRRDPHWRRCIGAFFNFLSFQDFQGQKMDFFWVSMDGARKIFKQNPAFEEAPLVDFS